MVRGRPLGTGARVTGRRSAIDPRQPIGTLDLHEAGPLEKGIEGGTGRQIPYYTSCLRPLEERSVVKELDARGLFQKLQGGDEVARGDLEVLPGGSAGGHPRQ